MYFPFELYIGGLDEKSYEEDLKKKNSIVKFVNGVIVAPDDKKALHKFLNSIIYFRNTFCKEAFLYFFLHKFDEKERQLLARVVFDEFVVSPDGVIGEYKDFYRLSYELSKDLYKNDDILDTWEALSKGV